MIRIQRPQDVDVLSVAERAALARRQQQVDSLVPGDQRIEPKWKLFLKSRPRKEITAKLAKCFLLKCAYCEAIRAIDIDHYYPKSAHPDKMFLWVNFLLCCKNCNNFKLAHFPIDNGQPRFLDPCRDDPLDFMRWDFLTGRIAFNPDPLHYLRAQETCLRLQLNAEPLCKERRKKLSRVTNALARVVRHTRVSPTVRGELIDELDPESPYLGIIRQLFRFPDQFERLVKGAQRKLPAIRDWISTWL